MFTRRARGLLDALAASLCVWVALYQTPAGALGQMAVGRLFHTHSSARPLLAYYSAGVYEAAADEGPPVVLTPPPLAAPLLPSQALAYGVQAALVSADASTRERVAPLATASGIETLTSQLGSPDLAVAALICGEEVVRFGRDRAEVSGRPIDLEALARALPPSQSGSLALASRALAMGEAFALRWPVPADTRITSPFGMRTHPILGTQQMHTGVDLSVPAGTEVRATGAGIVRRASEDAVNGKVVIIDHGRGVTTAYCHNSELLVTAGERIEAGQVIARSGSTGRSTGPHVHYQLALGGKPVDPLRFHRAELGSTGTAAATD